MTSTQRSLVFIAVAAAVLNLSNFAWDVLGPLWVTSELGLGADDWARLRSLRFAGTLAGTLVIGLASGVWGARTVGAVAFALAGGGLAGIAVFGRPALVMALPVFGAAVSAVFIALNTLTQRVGRAQQARANAVYRSVGAGVGAVAPLLATVAAASWGYSRTLAVAAGLLVAGAVVLVFYPRSDRPQGGFRGAVAALWVPLRNRHLRGLIGIEQAYCLFTSGKVAFVALILARGLELPDRQVGALLTLGAVAAFAGTLSAHRLQVRWGTWPTVQGGWIGAVAAALLLATAGGAPQAAFALLLGGFAGGLHIGPVSYAVARLGGEGGEAQSFTLWKILQSLTAVIGMQLCAVLEPHLGMTGVVAWGALGALVPIVWLRRAARAWPPLEGSDESPLPPNA